LLPATDQVFSAEAAIPAGRIRPAASYTAKSVALLVPVVAHGAMICPAAVWTAPDTWMISDVAFGPTVGTVKVTVAAFAWLSPPRDSVCMFPFPPDILEPKLT